MKNKKSLGQHWLKDRATLDTIADLALPSTAMVKCCLEIGPGLGTLTSSLLKRFEKVIAVEFDPNLAQNLPKSFPGKNLEVVNADILQFDFSKITEPYVVAGNIPYYITTPIILRLLEIVPQPQKIVLLVQKEVAERATPVKKQENLLSLTIKNRADASRGLVVGREMFTPPPKVDSEVLILEPHAELFPATTISLAKIGFSSPRKKLISNLTRGLNLPKEKLETIFGELGFDLSARPSDLELSDWDALRRQIML